MYVAVRCRAHRTRVGQGDPPAGKPLSVLAAGQIVGAAAEQGRAASHDGPAGHHALFEAGERARGRVVLLATALALLVGPVRLVI